MSWSLAARDVALDDLADKIRAQADEMKANGAKQYDTIEVQSQIDEAIDAASTLLESGAIGDGPWHVTLGGHANTAHKPAPGWANDAITVSVYQANRDA